MRNKSIINNIHQEAPNQWVNVAEFLLSNEEGGEWSATHKSFTDWLLDTSKKMSLSESSLWRYYRAAKYYINLRKELQAGNISTPEFTNLPARVSPENLEILEKIERVAPKIIFLDLAERVIHSNIKRDELRLTWIAYRKGLEGKTSRGMGVERPKINTKDPRHKAFIKEAQLLTALNANYKNCIGDNLSSKGGVFPNVSINTIGDGKILFDAIVTIEKDGLEFHGIEIRASNESELHLGSLKNQEKYCDFTWIAFNEFDSRFSTKNIPSNYGILALKGGNLEVIKKPAKNQSLNRLETSIHLLNMLIKG